MRDVIHLEGNSQSIPCPKLLSDFICTSKPFCYFSTTEQCALEFANCLFLSFPATLCFGECCCWNVNDILKALRKISRRQVPGDFWSYPTWLVLPFHPPPQCNDTHTNAAKCHQVLLKSNRCRPVKKKKTRKKKKKKNARLLILSFFQFIWDSSEVTWDSQL